MLLPHGAGHSRRVGTISGASGLSSDQLLGPHGELPAAIALPGPASEARLRIDCPPAHPRSRMIGDICLERLRLSRECREEYRRFLGIGNRTLVLFSSTWGPSSAYSTYPDLPRQLHHSLPADDFAVAFVPHPNIEAEHRGPLPQLHQPYFANGLFMPQPEEGWRALLLASDVVIGDHGSVSVYAAALDKPVGFAAFGFDEITPYEPLSDIGNHALSFDPYGDVQTQVERIIDAHHSGQYRQWTEQIMAEPDIAPSQALRDLVYELVDVPPPKRQWAPALLSNPAPAEGYRPTSAWIGDIDIQGTDVTWHRYPVAHHRNDTPTSPHAHTITDLSTRRPEWRSASVLLRHHEVMARWEAEAELERIFSTYPLCAAASVRLGPNETIIGTPRRVSLRAGKSDRPGNRLIAVASSGSFTDTALSMVASAIYWWQRTRDWNEFPDELTFRRGEARCRVTLAQTDSSLR